MKYDITYSCGHDGVVSLLGGGKERERKLTWYQKYGLCPKCYKADQEEKRKAMGLIASVRLPALNTLLSKDPYPYLCIVFDGDTLPYKETIKKMGATFTDDYPAKNAFIDVLDLSQRPKRWTMQVTFEQLEQALRDLAAINCKITECPTSESLAVFVQTYRYAKAKAESKRCEIEAQLQALGPKPEWPEGLLALWPSDSRWNGKIYGKSGAYNIYISNKKIPIEDELKMQIEAVQAARVEWNKQKSEIER